MGADPWESTLKEAGRINAVDPSDLREAWAVCRDGQTRNAAVGIGAIQRACSPGADLLALWYRAAMLVMLCGRPGLLDRWLRNGEPDASVFSTAATFPMDAMRPGVVRAGPPLDVEEFIRRVESESAK